MKHVYSYQLFGDIIFFIVVFVTFLNRFDKF
jgi:hypothetical protein